VSFQLRIPGSTPVSLLERESGFEIVTQIEDTGKTAIFTPMVYGYEGGSRIRGLSKNSRLGGTFCARFIHQYVVASVY
jgi:hypothetical protein